jgi:superfamily II DNA or RNA helicase
MFTGSGKTLIAAMLSEHYGRTMVIDPFINLCQQIARGMEKYLLRDVQIEQAELFADPAARTVCASLATLTAGDRGRRFKPDLVIVDEAHYAAGGKTYDLLEYYESQGAKIVGLTATPHAGPSGRSCLTWYRNCPVQYGVLPAIDHGWLVPIRAKRVVCTKLDYSGAAAKGFTAEEVERVLRQEAVLQEQAALVAATHQHPGAVYAHSIPTAKALRDLLQTRHGIPTALVHSKMTQAEKDGEMKRFESGEASLIVNVAVLTMGWDSLRCRELHVIRPTASLPRYLQVLGRALRPLGGTVDGQASDYLRRLAIANSEKPDCVVYDYTDTTRYHRVCSAIDVFLPPAKREKYREKLLKTSEGEPIDLTDLDASVKDEEARERERALLEMEQEKERRKGLLVKAGVNLEDVDVFAARIVNSPKRREARMLWGPWKGVPIRMIPKADLQKIVRTVRRSPGNEWLVTAIRRELAKVPA